MTYDEKTISSKSIYKGSIIDLDVLKVILPNGKEATRDIISHPGASVVVPLSENGEVYMVRQFRKPLEAVSLEIPAGKLDYGEAPKKCAIRELEEETGLIADNMKHVISIHSTPGFCNEVLHLFVATGLKEGKANPDEDEFISSEKIKVDTLVDMVLKHEITDAKSIIGILLAEKILKGEINL